MSLSWIDKYIDGVVDYCDSKDIFDIYNTVNINIKRVDKKDPILQGNDSLYIRNYFGIEIVFIRDDLHHRYEKFILAHELGHAILHTEITTAAYNNKLINKGKLERQADYFALQLLDISVNKDIYEGYTLEQIAQELYVKEECLNCIL